MDTRGFTPFHTRIHIKNTRAPFLNPSLSAASSTQLISWLNATSESPSAIIHLSISNFQAQAQSTFAAWQAAGHWPGAARTLAVEGALSAWK